MTTTATTFPTTSSASVPRPTLRSRTTNTAGSPRSSPDAGGPDARPDIYVSRFAPGSFGVAFPAADARGGAFTVVSNALDPSAESSLGSLYGTVAHELFHLVQFSYFSPADEPALPSWVLEGSAAAIEARVYPELDDIVSRLQLRHWFARPHQSLTAQSYGAQLLWRYLDEREPRVLPAYLERLAVRAPNATAALADAYRRVTGRPFARAFGRFASSLASAYPAGSLRCDASASAIARAVASRRSRSTFSGSSHATRSVRLTGPSAELLYEVESDVAGTASVTRRLTPRTVRGTSVYRIPSRLRHSARLGPVTLVIANGETSRVSYSVAVD